MKTYSVCVHTNKYLHAYMHTYMHAYMHAYMHTCIHTYIHTCIHTYMHTCIHTYIHAHIERPYPEAQLPESALPPRPHATLGIHSDHEPGCAQRLGLHGPTSSLVNRLGVRVRAHGGVCGHKDKHTPMHTCTSARSRQHHLLSCMRRYTRGVCTRVPVPGA